MVERNNPILSDTEREFVRSEVERLVEVIDDAKASHFRRAEIGDRLAIIGDTRFGVGVTREGIPDICWCEVDEESGGFLIAKYLVRYRQYRCFLDAINVRDSESGSRRGQFRQIDNCPAENVSFHEAQEFCLWLADLLSCEVRLPTEKEWERAARGPDSSFKYPWGRQWNPNNANTSDSRLSRTTAVGMYPMGNAACGHHGSRNRSSSGVGPGRSICCDCSFNDVKA